MEKLTNPPLPPLDMVDRYKGRAQTAAVNAECIGKLSARAADEMIRANAAEKIPLHQLDKIKQIAAEYLSECSDSGLPPSVRGVAARLGVTRGALYDYKRHHADSEFAKWLDDFSDLCAEIVVQGAIMGAYKEASAIFLAKARASWIETAQVDIKYNGPNYDRGLSQEELAEKYSTLIELDGEEVD